MTEIKVMAAKHETEMKALIESNAAALSQQKTVVTTGSGLTSSEKKEIFEALELLKSENATLKVSMGESAGGPRPN